MRIAILGTGNVGTALGTGWSVAGHQVVFGSRHPAVRGVQAAQAGVSRAVGSVDSLAGAARQGDVVVLAVPFDSVTDVITAAGDLAGRIVVDATNPAGKAIPPPHGSGAERVAATAPGAFVVKAFNTMGFETMTQPVLGGRRALGLVAGDDAEAKITVMALATTLGFEAVDAGDLTAARLLENLAELWIHLALRAGQGRDMAFSLLRTPLRSGHAGA